jgi:uncharacterized sulfatase
MMDLFTTALIAAGVAIPEDRPIDGADIMPLLTSAAVSPHQTILGLQGPDVMTIRNARWKLHVLPAADRRRPTTSKKRWIDPRAPDGVTLLAPYEQYQPSDYPGLRTGDAAEPMALFDLVNDPGEQHNVAASHPDVVKALKSEYDKAVESFGPLPKGRRGRPPSPKP